MLECVEWVLGLSVCGAPPPRPSFASSVGGSRQCAGTQLGDSGSLIVLVWQSDILIGNESMIGAACALAAVAGISVKMHTPYE